jgi:hypothetical protein
VKLSYKDTSALMKPHVHGHEHKDLIVLHETVSSDIVGWRDIDSVEEFLASKDYGIHGMTDAEGHIAWAYGLGDAVFWQAGGVNGRSIGIEQVSKVMIQAPTTLLRRKMWSLRQAELRATAKLCAAISNTRGIPLAAAKWNGSQFSPGIVTHFQVGKHYEASDGHTDCFPVHLGGYYPLYEVIQLAKNYALLGYTL